MKTLLKSCSSNHEQWSNKARNRHGSERLFPHTQSHVLILSSARGSVFDDGSFQLACFDSASKVTCSRRANDNSFSLAQQKAPATMSSFPPSGISELIEDQCAAAFQTSPKFKGADCPPRAHAARDTRGKSSHCELKLDSPGVPLRHVLFLSTAKNNLKESGILQSSARHPRRIL